VAFHLEAVGEEPVERDRVARDGLEGGPVTASKAEMPATAAAALLPSPRVTGISLRTRKKTGGGFTPSRAAARWNARQIMFSRERGRPAAPSPSAATHAQSSTPSSRTSASTSR
jgi:hypothetical protein